MADSDNTTILPSVTLERERSVTSMSRSTHFGRVSTKTLADPALALSQAWTQAHAAMAQQCLKQQQLETELLERRRSPANVDENLPTGQGTATA